MNTAEAVAAIENLQGTLGADLNSLRRDARHLLGQKPHPGIGHLNFALALVSLVGCEAAGFFVTGGSKEKPYACHSSDSGTYIIEFVDRCFPRSSDFRRVSKILADDLRHELVHGFGSRNPERPFELDVFASEEPAPRLSVKSDAGSRHLRVNSLLLADDTAAALEDLRKAVVTDEELAVRVEMATKIRFPVRESVRNQFQAFTEWYERQSRRGA